MKYAAYGSNLHPLRLRDRIGSAELIGTARLDDWSLRFHKRGQDTSGKCDIVPAEGSVHVAVFEVRPEDLSKLDDIEGVGRGYDTSKIDIPGYGECLTYRASATHIDETLIAFDWYRALVLGGAKYHGFPDAYVRRIAAVQVCRDPHRERRERHFRLLERLAKGG